MRAPKIIVQKDSAGEWYVSYRAANGRIIAVSRGYNKRSSAVKGAKALGHILRNGFWEFSK